MNNSQSSNNKQNNEFTLSKDGKTILLWNMGRGPMYRYTCVVIIPEGIENIAEGAFAGNENLDKIYFPKSLKKIGSRAFAGCGKFHILYNGETLESIGEYAFYGCNLLSVRGNSCLPKKIKLANKNSFCGCKVIHQPVGMRFQNNNWIPFVEENVQEKQHIVNDSVEYKNLLKNAVEDEFGVVYDSQYRYILKCNNKDLVKYEVKEGTVGIFKLSFFNISKLEEIDTRGVKHIGMSAFSGCTKLNKIHWGSDLKSIGEDAFSETGIVRTVLPKSLQELGVGVFSGCSNLDDIDLRCGIEVLPGGTFSNCKSLRNIKLSDNILEIGRMAFAYCSSLTNIQLPTSLIKLEELCFHKSGLESVVLPKNLVLMGSSPFCCCNNLAITSLSPFFYSDGHFLLAYNKTLLVSYLQDEVNVSVPNTVKVIMGSSFSSKKNTHRIFLPDSVECIAYSAFAYAKADIVNIPKSVHTIDPRFDWHSEVKEFMFSSDYIKNTKISLSSGAKIIEY